MVAAIAAVVLTHAWLLIPFVLFFAVALTGLSYDDAVHAPALRVDERGVSLTRSALPGRSRKPVLVAWSDMQAVVLAKMPRSRALSAVYVLMRSDEGLSGATLADLMPYVPTERCVALTNWTIDVRRLSDVVHIHEPSVAVVDQR